MTTNKIPEIVLKKAEASGCDEVRLIVSGDVQFGDVYQLFHSSNGGPVVPTGLPFLVSYRDGALSDIGTEDSFRLLAIS